MILSGKNLLIYRMNQIKKLAIMFASVFAMAFFMMFACITFC